MMEIIAVFNTAGFNGRENAQWYTGAIHGLLNQKDVNFRVVLSSWKNNDKDRDWLVNEFKDRISYNFIDTHAPVSITFNHTCELAMREFGRPEAFLYADSGTHTQANHLVFRRLLDHHKAGNIAMTAAMVDEDAGLEWLFPGQSEEQVFRGQSMLEIPLGKTLNLHFQLFDPVLMDAFGRLLPDVFASYAMESTFTFMCAAVRRKFLAVREMRIRHAMSMDGASSGFNEGMGWAHWLPEAPRLPEAVIMDPEARMCGFGIEECKQILMHNPAAYDGQNCKDPERLRRFIKDNIFLPPDRYDYNAVESVWVP